jgi:hypothetical protein
MSVDAQYHIQLRTFIPQVLADQRFISRGYLTGESPQGYYWVVIDPARHNFQVWQKKTGLSYLAFGALVKAIFLPFLPQYRYRWTALTLNSSGYSNGPMMEVGRPADLGRLLIQYVGVIALASLLGVTVLWTILSGSITTGALVGALAALGLGVPAGVQKAFEEWSKKFVPFGFVEGTAAGVHDPGMGYNGDLVSFGRGPSQAFPSFKLSRTKSPTGFTEGMGGLIPVIVNYVPSTIVPNTPGYSLPFTNLTAKQGITAWGLIPLDGSAVPPPDGWSPELPYCGPLSAEELGYDDDCNDDCDDGCDDGCDEDCDDDRLDGVIIVAGNDSSGIQLPKHFATIGVRDGVAMDGSDSVMMGSQTDEYLDRIPWYKDLIQRYGFYCS